MKPQSAKQICFPIGGQCGNLISLDFCGDDKIGGILPIGGKGAGL